ncbi:NAD(P)-binding protein [Lophium mytilinum]|uniref:NAD(P)-binding protein n=1 Tax=Lophium mytilinum TaxID=390894 RepID=A0A6A6QYH5_9PEZI|nr:NAD(P)-binding protein [Lophium mytilinum]
MPIPFAAAGLFNGISAIPFGWTAVKAVIWVAVLVLLKRYFNGASNTSERVMHSKVVMITGGTSGIGAEVARGLATRGAQIVLLTQQPLSDPFLVDFIMDMRAQTNNELITAESVDLASLHSIRLFATKWVDNAPPRRIDTIILCADTRTPSGGKASITEDGLESSWGLNYLANFHLLSILSPALRAQPPDRDVRIVFGTCSSYMGGTLPDLGLSQESSEKGAKSKSKSKSKQQAAAAPKQAPFTPSSAYATSKLAVMTFASAFQKHLAAYARPDKKPMNSRVILVDPGWTRTPGMRRYLTFGSLWGLALYLVMWPFWWLVLKGPEHGAQTFLYAAMDEHYGRGEGGRFLKECREVKFVKPEIEDEEVQKKLWELSENTIQALEKEAALRRAKEKKEKELKNDAEKKNEGKTDASATTSGNDGKTAGSRRTKKAS